MEARTVLLAIGLPLAPWAWRVFRELAAEVQAASDSRAPEPASALLRPTKAARPTWAPRAPAFRGDQARAAVRGRWEGGFGRRSP